MIQFITRDAGWKLFSLLVAVLLWVAYARDPEIGAFVSVPVEYRSMPDDLEIGSDLVGSVSLDLLGPSEKIANFSTTKSAVMLNFAPIHRPGEDTFQIDERNLSLPFGVRLVRAIPAQIRLQFEKRAETRVPVQVRFSGSPPNGYQLERYEAEPTKLAVVGPQSHVDRVEFAVTDPVDLSAVVAQSEFHVGAFLGDAHVRFEKPQSVTVRVFVDKKRQD